MQLFIKWAFQDYSLPFFFKLSLEAINLDVLYCNLSHLQVKCCAGQVLFHKLYKLNASSACSMFLGTKKLCFLHLIVHEVQIERVPDSDLCSCNSSLAFD